VITAGPVPPNASELVLSPKVQQLFSELKSQYDIVIVDTPPIMLISDAMVLMRLVDVGLFILNTEKATRSGVKYIEELLQNNKIENTALILNNIKAKKWRYYYSKYGYRYGYGYGYGSGYGYGYGSDSATKNKG
jgi:Mrp family chromosome partitioning ATPase